MNHLTIQRLILVGVMIFATLITRFLPFFLFPAGKKTPKYVTYLGTALPYATIGLLVVYCLKGIDFIVYPHAIPEIMAIAVIVILHVWKGNSLLSIGVGTAVYMILVQVVFTA